MGSSNIPYLDWAWSPMTGCTRCAKECQNCWAFTMAARWHWDMTPRFHWSVLMEPQRWRCRSKGLVGVDFRSDLFHEAFPVGEICCVLNVMRSCEYRPERYLVLTKRPHVAADILTGDPPPDNLWLGYSAGCMESLERGWPYLSRIPLGRRVLSAEPLLGPLEVPRDADWVIVGAESGAKRRTCSLEWVQSIAEQCRTHSIPCYVKQLSIGGKVSHDPTEWPESLWVREFPADRPYSCP